MKNVLIAIVLICFANILYSQGNRADRFFEKGDYINAALYYEEALKKEVSKSDLQHISECYYNIFEYRKAAHYLNRLIEGKFKEEDKSIDDHYYFMAYHMLSALGDYDVALDYLKTYSERINRAFDKKNAIEIIEDFKLKDADYDIKRVSFNSPASDFGAVKLFDSIYFTSDRDDSQLFTKTYKWTHRPFLDIYNVKVDDDLNPQGYIKAISKVINSKFHEGNFCFSMDGMTMYISRSDFWDGKKEFDKNDTNNIHIFKSEFSNGQWSELEKLPFNKTDYSYQHPALSPDGKKLYFSSNMEGGFGSFDVYYVDITPNGYGEPVNLGPVINTANREHFPFVSEDGNLFFSSNGHLGMGMLDIFVSEWIDGDYTMPINLGSPVNSQYDDFNLNYYDGANGFFASNRNRSDDEIFSFKQTGEIFIREYINTFEIRDEVTESYIPNVDVELYDSKGQLLYSNTLDSIAVFNKNLTSGSYVLKGVNEKYVSNNLKVKVLEKQDQTHVLYLKLLPPPDPVEVVLEEKGIDKTLKDNDPQRFEMLVDTIGPPIVEKNGKLFFELKPIYFDFDMWNIRADSKVVLDELAAKLDRYPDIKIKISSHTDSRGTDRYNQILSEKRAESTRNYLALEGYVNARRMQFHGYGETQLVAKCSNSTDCTEEEHQLNRRSEFEIIDY